MQPVSAQRLAPFQLETPRRIRLLRTPPAPAPSALPASVSAPISAFGSATSGASSAFAGFGGGSAFGASSSAPQGLAFKGAANGANGGGAGVFGGAAGNSSTGATGGAPAPTFGNKSWVNPDYARRPGANGPAPSGPAATAPKPNPFGTPAAPPAGSSSSFFGAAPVPATQSATTFTSPVRLASPSFPAPGSVRPMSSRSGSRSSRPPQRAPH